MEKYYKIFEFVGKCSKTVAWVKKLINCTCFSVPADQQPGEFPRGKGSPGQCWGVGRRWCGGRGGHQAGQGPGPSGPRGECGRGPVCDGGGGHCRRQS